MLFNELWSATDAHGDSTRCELNRATPEGLCADEPFYQISMTEGPFSGYPTIDIDLKSLIDLYSKIGDELRRRQTAEAISNMRIYNVAEGWSPQALPQQRKPEKLDG